MGALTAAEIAKSMFAIVKCADRIALYVRTIEEALDDLGAGTSLSSRIDASGVNLLEGHLRNQDTNDLDSWLTGQSGDYIWAHRMLQDWINDLYRFMRSLLADIGEASHHGTLIENALLYYGLRVPEYFLEMALRSQGKETSLGPDVVFPDGGGDDGLEKNLIAAVTGAGASSISVVDGLGCPSSATPAAIQWICTTNITGGNLNAAVTNAYGQNTWSDADAAAATFNFSVANGVTAGQTGDLVAPGTGQTLISGTDSGTIELLAATLCALNMTLDTPVHVDPDTELALTFTLAGTSAIPGDTLDITGTDADGAEASESIDVGGGDGAYVTTELFATVTDIDCTGWGDGTLACTQRARRSTSLKLNTNETDKFYVSATAYQRVLIVGTDADSGNAVSIVATIKAIPDGETLLLSNEIHFNIDTGYSIYPMYDDLTEIVDNTNAATGGVIAIYPKDDRALAW